jgi:quercetin dioxygenase-like cupin family protein
MNLIQEIQEKLESSTKPVARLYHQTESSKTMFIGFKSGMTLEQHKTDIPAKLMVLTGKVIYRQGEDSTTLQTYETKEIPVDTLHEVYAEEDSLCMLTKG